jgi:hypothetical protein
MANTASITSTLSVAGSTMLAGILDVQGSTFLHGAFQMVTTLLF